MVTKIEQILNTKSELEFFLILINAVKGDLHRVRDTVHGNGISLTVKQTLYWEEAHRKVFELKTTHVFALFQDGTLTWAILAQPTITGLLNIQAVLTRIQDTRLQLTGLGDNPVNPTSKE